MSHENHFDCQMCGACCLTAGEVCVYESDPTPPQLTHLITGQVNGDLMTRVTTAFVMKRRRDDACVAFRGRVGGPCVCKIHSLRPYVCAEFEPGSIDCLEARGKASDLGFSLTTTTKCAVSRHT